MSTAQKSATTAIKALLSSYNTALAASDTLAVVKLYTPDAVFMPQSIPTVIGTDAIRACYDAIFQAIHLDVKFDVLEVVVASEEWAFARTASTGIQKQLKSGEESHEANQELFVCQVVDGEWLIARYCFCTVNPPK